MNKPLILCLESATRTCSVALFRGDELLKVLEATGSYSHAENLAAFADRILKEEGVMPGELSAVAVSKGPGSYTGLRIGVSLAKGICLPLGIPLLGIETLDAMASLLIRNENPKDGMIVPMIDARRMEVYTATYDRHGSKTTATRALILEKVSFSKELESGPVWFFGDGSEKAMQLLAHPNAIFSTNEFTSATGLIDLALRKFQAGDFENLASFEPYYLKDFVAGKGSV